MSLYSESNTPRPKHVPVHSASRAQVTIDWDALDFEEDEEELQEILAEAEEDQVCEPVPAPMPLRQPTTRELAIASNLCKDSVSVNKLRREIADKAPVLPAQDDRYDHSVTSISSESPLAHAPSPLWNPHAFQRESAISSEQLYPQQRRVGFRESVRQGFGALVDLLTDSHPPPHQRPPLGGN